MAAIVLLPPLVGLVSFARLVSIVTMAPGRVSPCDDEALTEWVDTVLRRLPRPWRFTCLKRSLVLYYVLRRCGRDVGLRIGVRRDKNGKIDGHAWLIRYGEPYLETDSTTPSAFRVIASFPDDSTPVHPYDARLPTADRHATADS